MFNDTFGNLTLDNAVQDADGNEINSYNMTVAGTSWSHEGDLYGKTKYKPNEVVPPPNWQEQYPNGEYGDELPDLHTWEQFQVWMRTAGLPTFSKLYQRNDKVTLRAGTYRLKIYDRMSTITLFFFFSFTQANGSLGFPVDKYAGTKSILISTRT